MSSTWLVVLHICSNKLYHVQADIVDRSIQKSQNIPPRSETLVVSLLK